MMTSKEMMKTKARPGYWWVNVAPLGSKPNWKEQVCPFAKPSKISCSAAKDSISRQHK